MSNLKQLENRVERPDPDWYLHIAGKISHDQYLAISRHNRKLLQLTRSAYGHNHLLYNTTWEHLWFWRLEYALVDNQLRGMLPKHEFNAQRDRVIIGNLPWRLKAPSVPDSSPWKTTGQIFENGIDKHGQQSIDEQWDIMQWLAALLDDEPVYVTIELKGTSPMKVRPTETQALVAAAKASQGLIVEPPNDDTLSPEYLKSLEEQAEAEGQKIIDAEFSDLDEANARNADDERPALAADEFVEPEGEAPKKRFDRLWWIGQGEPDQDATEIGVFKCAGDELLFWHGQITEDIKKLGVKVRNYWIATGAQLATWYKAATLWSIAEQEKFNKNWLDFKKRVRDADLLRKQERRINSHVTAIVFEEHSTSMHESMDKLRKEFIGRITALEKIVLKGVAPAPKPDYSKLDELLKQVFAGKLVHTVKVYREMTGCTLQEAKDKIESLVAA